MAHTNPPEGASEKLQIAILTFFMTAGGFLLLTLALELYFIPQGEARMKGAEKTYEEIATLLEQEDMRRLRQQDRLNREKGDEEDLRQLISQNLTNYGLEYSEFRSARTSTKPGGVTEISQPINLQPASMTPILQFVTAVEEARKSIRVSALDLSRNKRAAEDADSWQATVTFVEYETGSP